MDMDKNAYWVAHQPMPSLSDADRAKLQRRATLQLPSTSFQKKAPASSLNPELRDIFEKKLKSSAYFKPVAEVTPEELPESPQFQDLPVVSDDFTPDNAESEEMKKTSILLTRTLLFAERRRKEGREVFRRRTQAAACLPDAVHEPDVAPVPLECRSMSPSAESEKNEMPVAPVEEDADDTVASFPKYTDTSFSSVDLTDRAPETPWSRSNELLAQLKQQLSHVVVHMISSAESSEEEKEEAVDPDHPLYSAPLPEADNNKAKLKWYERPFKTHPFEYIPKPSPRLNCLCPGIVDF